MLMENINKIHKYFFQKTDINLNSIIGKNIIIEDNQPELQIL